MSLASQSEILDFWFKETPPERWFAADPAFDATIRARFEDTWRAGAADAFASWADTMRGALALIVLLDQFPRNMFRGQAAAFATDELAEVAARAAIARGFDVEAPVSVRSFFYLPLMHSEDVLDHRNVSASRAPASARSIFPFLSRSVIAKRLLDSGAFLPATLRWGASPRRKKSNF